MPFPFSFKFAVPGVANPFAQGTSSDPAPGMAKSVDRVSDGSNGHANLNAGKTQRRPASPSLVPPQPLARKRGWVPPSAEPSVSAATETSTNGYLDTPSKYRDMAEQADADEIEEMVGDLPPPKRRRTLAGSIVSTAMSAALIGTAVGLTVYRLWRNRGKHPEALPPPPYEQGEWLPPSEQRAEPAKHASSSVAQEKLRKQRHERRHSVAKRPLTRSRNPQRRTVVTYPNSPPEHMPPPSTFAVPTPPTAIPATLAPAEEEQEAGLDDHMDWMGDQLAILIAQGRRALGTEVVVMSESKEDEVDDGSGAWVEDDDHLPASSSGSLRGRRKARPSNIGVLSPPPSYTSPPATPSKNRWDATHSRQPSSAGLSLPPSSRPGSRRQSISSARSWADALQEEDDTLESPELREAMKKAREAFLKRRSQAPEGS